MAGNKLVCPNCGHDGTPETSRLPLGPFGFNYLAEGVVCRDVLGYDSRGRLRLSGDFKCEGTPTANSRLECRSCWRTFPVPEGALWATEPETPPRRPAAPATSHEPAPEGPGGAELSATAISQGLASILRAAVQEAQSATVLRLARLEVSVASLAQAAGETPSLRAEVAALRDQTTAMFRAQEQTPHPELRPGPATAGLVEQVTQLREMIARQAADAKERADALDAAHREAAQARSWLGDVIAQLEVGEQAIRQRLEGQADAIRGLHVAAQTQVTYMEELRTAVQRLEEIISALHQAGRPPEGP